MAVQSDFRPLARAITLRQPEGMPTPEQHAHESARYEKPDRPLALRLYACPHLVALVRLFGDRELSADEVKHGMVPLDEQFGKERMLTAAEELLVSISYGRTLVFRLNAEVRKLAVQILGPVPAPSPVSGASTVPIVVPVAAATQPITPTVRRQPATDEPSADEPPHKTTPPTPAPSAAPAESSEGEHRAIENFETFLIHFWLTGSEELCEYCMGLVEQVREDVPICDEVTEQGWSLEAATVHYVATDLRVFVEQEALASRTDQMHADLTRQMLDRIGWRELAESFLSGE